MDDQYVARRLYELHINIKKKSSSERANQLEKIVGQGLRPAQWKVIQKRLDLKDKNSYDAVEDMRKRESKAVLL